MNLFQTIFRYLNHQIKAETRYSIHSPFVYEFVTRVLPHKKSPAGDAIEQTRQKWLKSKQVVEIEDWGAGYGGVAIPTIRKTVSEVVKGSARSRREGELLYRLAHHYQPQTILEFGTNLGFSSLYLAKGAPKANLLTVEGSESLSQLALQNHQAFQSSPQIFTHTFEDFLAKEKETLPPIDLFFLDGNHRMEPTLRYVEAILPKMSANGMIILDDIRWSSEMESAWNQLITYPQLNVTLDLFSMGICFVNRPQAREHFKLRFRPV